MRYATARAFRAALEARLLDASRSQGPEALVALRKQVAFDRLLARLLAASPFDWMLKGGSALYIRMPSHFRFTRDLDLVLPYQPSIAMTVMLEAARHELDDYFTFQLTKSRQLPLGDGANTVRFTFRSRLDGRLFEDVTVDVGLDARSPLPPDILGGSDLLLFAGLPTLTIPTLPIEVHLAEKLHAYCKDYGPDRSNTRVKDLVDMVLIIGEYALTAERMRIALDHTFRSRALQPLPRGLEAPPAAWTGPYRTLAASLKVDPDLLSGHAFAARMLDPLLAGAVDDATIWHPGQYIWISE